MESKRLSLIHLVQYPDSCDSGTESKYPTIVALHGRGSNERDLIGLAPFLPDDLLWVSPRGSFPLGPDGYEWFQLTQVGKPDPARLANALHTLDRFIEEIMEAYPVDGQHLYLLGFSQGTVVSLSYAATLPQRVTGVIAHSGYLPHDSGLFFDETGLKNKPFLFAHGKQDSVLPVDWARRSRDTLHKLGADVEYHEFDMGHEITAPSLAVVTNWLARQRKR